MAFSFSEELRLVATVAETGALDLSGWLKTAESFVELLEKPPAVAGNTQEETIINIIVAQAAAFGPSPTTGGQLNKVTLEQAQEIAPIILVCSQEYKLEAALILAGLQGESKCDPNAVNPNNQDSKPGEDAHAKFLHTDFGIAQFDGSTLIYDPLFSDISGLSDAQIEAKIYDPAYAIPKFCAFVNRLYKNTNEEIFNKTVLLSQIPNMDPNILTLQAYNAGVHGSALVAKNSGANGNWSYGKNWVARMQSNLNLIGSTLQK